MPELELNSKPACLLHEGNNSWMENRQFWLTVTVLAVLLGTIFRAGQYLSRQSIRSDEAALLLNIENRGYADLCTSHLSNGQAAPPLFLIIQRWLLLSIGRDDLTMRLVPFVAGLMGLILFACLAHRLLPAYIASFSTILMACSDKFIWQSAAVKQYSGDVLMSLVILALGVWVMDRERPLRHLILGLVGAAGLWFSHAVIIVFAGISFVFLLRALQKGMRSLFGYTAWNVPFLASFLALYFTSIRYQNQDSYLQDFWSTSYIDWSHPLGIPLWLVERFRSLCSYGLSPFEWLGIWLIPLIAMGIFYWWKSPLLKTSADSSSDPGNGQSSRWWLGLLLAPIGMNILAAAVAKYPFSGSRVNLFLIPSLLLLAGTGLHFLLKQAPQRRSFILLAIALPLVLVPMLGGAWYLVSPRNKERLAPVIAYLQIHRQQEEPIYTGKNPCEFAWYWPAAPGIVRENVPSAADAPGQFWVIWACKPENQKREFREEFDPIRTWADEVDRIIVPGGGGFHFHRKAEGNREK